MHNPMESTEDILYPRSRKLVRLTLHPYTRDLWAIGLWYRRKGRGGWTLRFVIF